MRQFIIILIIVLFGTCTTSKSDRISNNRSILNHFTAEETKELESIHDFFMTYITESKDKNSSDAIADLVAFLEQLKIESESGVINIPIPFDEEKEFLSSLTPPLFGKIWYKIENSEELAIAPESTYLSMLDELGVNHPTVNQYKDMIQSAGDISAGAIALLLLSPEAFDLNDSAVRLIVAIHYLTYDYNGKLFLHNNPE